MSKMYFSQWKPPEVSERMWSVNLDASISVLYGIWCPVSSVLNLSIDLNSLTLAKSN